MLREATYHLAAVNVLDVSSESMAAFQVFIYGRFWVFTEGGASICIHRFAHHPQFLALPLVVQDESIVLLYAEMNRIAYCDFFLAATFTCCCDVNTIHVIRTLQHKGSSVCFNGISPMFIRKHGHRTPTLRLLACSERRDSSLDRVFFATAKKYGWEEHQAKEQQFHSEVRETNCRTLLVHR
jgi:hypothetical protein